MSNSFAGFEPANTTPVPDVLFDELLSTLSGTELKALLYIIRRTWGFKKQSDAISLSQFQKGILTRKGKQLDHGCGIKDRGTLIATLDSLEAKGYITSVKQVNENGEHHTTIYRIRFREGSGQNPLPGVVGKTHQSSRKNRTTPGGQTPPPVVGESDLQETDSQETDSQETEEEENRGKNKDTAERSTAEISPLFLHPLYDFLAFDDLESPTVMLVYHCLDGQTGEIVEPVEQYRGWKAFEVLGNLHERGVSVAIRHISRPDQLPIATKATADTGSDEVVRSPSEQERGGISQSPPVTETTSTPAAQQENTTSEPTGRPTGQSPEKPDEPTGTPPAPPSSPPPVQKTNKTRENKKSEGEDAGGSGQSGDQPGCESREKVVDLTARRVEQVYSWLNECMREATGKPDLSYARTEKFTTAIVEHALPCNPTREEIKLTWFDMWNEEDTGKPGLHWWRGRGRLTPAAWARHHADRLMSIMAERNTPPAKPGSTATENAEPRQGGRRNLSAEFREMRKQYGSRQASSRVNGGG